MRSSFAFSLLCLVFDFDSIFTVNPPLTQNLHYSGDPTEMMITWATMAKATKSVVEYGERYKQPLNKKAYGSATEFKTCGWKPRTIYIHRVKLGCLTPGRGYGIMKEPVSVSKTF